jgi:hypothetical protein
MTGEVTRLTALRRIVTAPQDHVDQQRIGSRVIYATPSAKVWIHRVVSFAWRKAS